MTTPVPPAAMVLALSTLAGLALTDVTAEVNTLATFTKAVLARAPLVVLRVQSHMGQSKRGK